MKKSLIVAFCLLASSAAFAVDNNSPAANTTTAAVTTTDNNGASTTTSSTSTTTTSNASGKKAISVSNLLAQLQKAGYLVKEVDYDKDNQKFKVTAIDRHGDSQTLDLDATAGLSADQRKPSHDLSIAQAAKKVEKNGSYIKSIQFDNGGYSATVVDKAGNDQSVTIDAKSGKVTNS